jgi:intein/homing endonuclease
MSATGVLATDPATGETAQKDVVATIVGTGDKILVEITVAGGSTLVATHNHPFWVNGTLWRDAVDLRPGDLLRTAAGTYVQVTPCRCGWTGYGYTT